MSGHNEAALSEPPHVRVAYVVGWEGGADTGPYKKIAEQARIWQSLGADIKLFVLTTTENAAAWESLGQTAQVITREPDPLRLSLQKERLLRHALSWRPQLVYHRYSLAYPGLVMAVRRVPVVVEVNTDDLREYRLIAPRKGIVNAVSRGLVLGKVAGLVAVTQELAESRSFARFSRPTVVVANGIDLGSVREMPRPTGERIRLIFIGQPHCPWHGLDKVIQLALARPQWHIDVVGPNWDEIRALAGAIPANILAHGLLDGPGYELILAQAHIGLGSLALYRKGMTEASTLKLREYLAVGLPSIIGYTDTDFPNGAPFLLQLPNRPDNVSSSLSAIDEFISSQAGRRVARASIAHLDSLNKERRRLRFLSSVSAVGHV